MTDSKWVPWLDGILVKDCYVVKDLQIDIAKPGELGEAPRHLILTGRNGSGKSSILRALENQIIYHRAPIIAQESFEPVFDGTASGKGRMQLRTRRSYAKNADLRILQMAPSASIENSRFDPDGFLNSFGNYLYASFQTERNRAKDITVEYVEKILREHSVSELDSVGMEFERFILSLKFSALFSKEERNEKMNAYYDHFFETITTQFRRVFEDERLKLDYDMLHLTFSFIFGDGRNVNVRDLADGYFSFVMIVLNIFTRQEEIRRELGYPGSDIPGLVLIDEPELHLHLDLQYQIMPLLTELFPKIQFIVATHSPAVISSIRNATVYDLSKREYAPSYIAGESFSSLMETHFGLENEFGPVADELLGQVKHIYLNGGTKLEKSAAIRTVMEKYQDIITPTLRVELESTIIHLEAEKTR